MRKKLLLTFMLMFASLTILIGCNGKEERKPVTLTVYSQLANYSGKMTGWFAQEVKERFNVEMIIVPEAEGVYDTRMESGNLGDIVIWGDSGEKYLNAVEQGMLFDWEEDNLLDDYGPYIKEHMPLALEKNRDISGTGKIYGFGHDVAPTSDDHASFLYTWDIRWDLYDRLGRPEINDLDDYFNLMVQMKELEPTDDQGNPTYAISLWPDWDGDMVMYVKAFASAYYGYDELGFGLYNPDTGDYYGALDPNGPYLEMLKFFNRLYRANLLDPDSMTNTFDNMVSKVVNGGTFFSIFNYAGSIAYNTPTNIENNKIMLPLAPNDARTIVYGMNVMGGERIWSIGSKTQYPELALEIINWLSTPEGKMISQYGPKGVTWEYDEEGYTTFTELGKVMYNDQDTMFPEDSGYNGSFRDGSFQLNNTTWSLDAINPDSNGEKYHWEHWKSNQTEPRNDVEEKWRETTKANSAQEYMELTNYRVALGTSFTLQPKSPELRLKWSQVTKEIVDKSWTAIYAKSEGEFNAIVRQMTNNANAYGYQDCLEWILEQAAIRHQLEEEVRSTLGD